MNEVSLLPISGFIVALIGLLGWLLKKWLGPKIEAVYQQRSESLIATIQRDGLRRFPPLA